MPTQTLARLLYASICAIAVVNMCNLDRVHVMQDILESDYSYSSFYLHRKIYYFVYYCRLQYYLDKFILFCTFADFHLFQKLQNRLDP